MEMLDIPCRLSFVQFVQFDAEILTFTGQTLNLEKRTLRNLRQAAKNDPEPAFSQGAK